MQKCLFGATTVSITTLSLMTFIAAIKNTRQHKKKRNATLSIKVLEAECRIFIVILNVVKLGVIRLIVVAPFLGLKISFARS